MAKPAHAPQTTVRDIHPAHGDPIRVVPLNVPQDLIGEKAAPAVAPQLTYRNGPLIETAEVFTIFLGPRMGKKSGKQFDIAGEQFFFLHSHELTDRPTGRI